MADLQHITPEQIAQYGVVAAPDRLTGRAEDNKKIFDRLVRELVAVVVNSIIDKTNELLAAEDIREENEKERVAAELLRVEAENLRVQAEKSRVTAENDRVRAEAERVAAELLRVKAEQIRVTAEQSRVNAEKGRVSAEQAREQAEKEREDSTNGIVAQATAQAQAAGKSAQKAENAADASKSWAMGGTGTRPDEDTNNASYWASKAQAEADRATVPSVSGVYNIILTDTVTNDRYALIVENKTIKLLGVSPSLDATDMTLIDLETGISYALVVESRTLYIKEVV